MEWDRTKGKQGYGLGKRKKENEKTKKRKKRKKKRSFGVLSMADVFACLLQLKWFWVQSIRPYRGFSSLVDCNPPPLSALLCLLLWCPSHSCCCLLFVYFLFSLFSDTPLSAIWISPQAFLSVPDGKRLWMQVRRHRGTVRNGRSLISSGGWGWGGVGWGGFRIIRLEAWEMLPHLSASFRQAIHRCG